MMDVYLAPAAWDAAMSALLDGESVKGFSLATDDQGNYALALKVDGCAELYPLKRPDACRAIRPQ